MPLRTRAFWFTVAAIATALLTAALTPKPEWELPDGFKRPILAAELVKDADAIRKVYGEKIDPAEKVDPEERRKQQERFREKLKWNTFSDFLFIASYGTMFYLLGRIAGGALGRVVSIGAVVAALSDVVENVGILRTIYGAARTDALALSTSVPSYTKWSLLALICVLVGGNLLAARQQVASVIDGLLYMVAGAWMGWSLFHPDQMEFAMGGLLLAIPLQLVVLRKAKA